MNIDKPSLKSLRSEIDAALEQLAKRHGITLKAGNVTYDGAGNYATFKLEVTKAGVSKSEAKLAADFTAYRCIMPAEQQNWLGRTLNYRGETWTVVGYNPRRELDNIVIKSPSGRMVYVAPVAISNLMN